MDEKLPKKITFRLRRFDPDKDTKPHYQDFEIDLKPGMTVLDGLHEVKQKHDSTIAMRYSCRMGVCGSCAMLINGKPSLACNTQVSQVSSKMIIVAPLPNFEIIKDLVPDLAPMLAKHVKMHPYVIREDENEMQSPSGEFYQSPEELVKYLQFAYCIKCGACMAACPTLATDDEYMGPMPLTQGHRFDTDTRDMGFDERKMIAGDSHGVFRCHYGGECSNVCPKGVDPARALQLMKRDLVFDYLKLRKKRKPCSIMHRPKDVKRKENIPDAPAYTVK